jgi:ADP-ribose pyrophosphatase YjhB (NUDIX family)
MSTKLVRLAFLMKELWALIDRPVQLGVRIMLVQDGKVLLVRHTYMPGWHFPGGAVNRWETPLEAAAREAREEAGAELLEAPTLVEIATSYDGGKSDHVALYLCRKYRIGRATDRWEIAEVKLFAVDELPAQLWEKWRKLLPKLAADIEQG